jgi:two-component system C4-dicarboxylate transport sensor histidine kinase DctB
MPGAKRRITLKLRGFRALHWGTFVAASAMLFVVSLWEVEAWNQRLAIEAVHNAETVTAASYSMLLQSEIEKRRLVPFILAYDPDVIAALSVSRSVPASPTTLSFAAARTALSHKFAFLCGDTTASVIYLMDANGTVVAASNWRQPTSFVGHNFALRPYYSDARAEGTGEYFALGMINHLPGLFLAQRVEEDGRFLGVVVVKVEFKQLEDSWAQRGAKILVADDKGVVLITDVSDWQFRTIAPLSEDVRVSLRAKARYGAAPLAPLPFDAADDGQLLVQGGKRFVSVAASVPTTRWTIYFLAPLDAALSLGNCQDRLLAGFFTALISGLAYIIRARLQRGVVAKAQAADMKRLATTDSLTRLLNRRAFEQILDEEWRRARRAGTSLAVIMVDVDYFKLFNDFYGHLAGDECLRTIAGVFRNSAKRPGDAVARYGGEEFILLLPNTDPDGVVQIAETILKATRALEIPHEKAPLTGYVTISVGVADFVVRDGVTVTSLVSAADQALYEAKRAGRDRIAYQRTRHESDSTVG